MYKVPGSEDMPPKPLKLCFANELNDREVE